jgi:penicillin-binding protein A
VARRIRWFGIAMIVCFCGLLLQLDNIQGLKASQYQHAAANPVTTEAEYAKPRGKIVSSDGVTLAISEATPSSLTYKYQRVYPTGSLFAQIVGFTSFIYSPTPGAGSTGVEAQYNAQLTYHTQPVRALGDLLNTQQGTDTVVLTLSDKIQTLAESALGGKDGAVVVLDPSNGNVLAMYSNPSFNPNPIASQSGSAENAGWAAYKASDSLGFVRGASMAIDEAFHPGSAFKVITSAAAFDHSPSVTTESFPYVSSFIPPGTNQVLHNASDEICGGPFTGPYMLAISCDTGFASVGLKVGAANLAAEAASFGFWSRPPIDLPTSPYSVSQMCTGVPGASTESSCALNLEADNPFLAYSAIGQGNVDATPLEMAMVASAIANDGIIMKPHVMSRILDSNDNVIQIYQPTRWLDATSPQTAASISRMMQAVVSNPVGTAYGLFPSSWQVAAKTGTAQDLSNTATTDWMIAFAPASHPEVAIAVVVPDQGTTASGATVSGPIVRTVLNGLFGGNG